MKRKESLRFSNCRWPALLFALGLFAGTSSLYGALPSGWNNEDIGSPAYAGSANYTNGVWIISGSGAGIGNTNDQFSFCSNTLNGDGVAIARVLSQSSTDTEGRSQFNMWAILGAPLMIGTDVRTTGGAYAPPLSAATLATLTNTQVIAVDQDPLGAVGRPVGDSAARSMPNLWVVLRPASTPCCC